jgi:hypothetical protein
MFIVIAEGLEGRSTTKLKFYCVISIGMIFSGFVICYFSPSSGLNDISMNLKHFLSTSIER